MRNIIDIEKDVKWWTDDVRAKKEKMESLTRDLSTVKMELSNSERKLSDRTYELQEANRADQQKQKAA